jgi:hypothetical protein
MMEEIDVVVGGWVYFTDATGSVHNAIVTAVHGPTSKKLRDEQYEREAADPDSYWHNDNNPYKDQVEERLQVLKDAPFIVPSINLVYVAGDKGMTDPYGRQILRATSVVHESVQPAAGMKYRTI